jgi:hypothetical protein
MYLNQTSIATVGVKTPQKRPCMSPHFRFPHGNLYTIAIHKQKIIFKSGLAIKLYPTPTPFLR